MRHVLTNLKQTFICHTYASSFDATQFDSETMECTFVNCSHTKRKFGISTSFDWCRVANGRTIEKFQLNLNQFVDQLSRYVCCCCSGILLQLMIKVTNSLAHWCTKNRACTSPWEQQTVEKKWRRRRSNNKITVLQRYVMLCCYVRCSFSLFLLLLFVTITFRQMERQYINCRQTPKWYWTIALHLLYSIFETCVYVCSQSLTRSLFLLFPWIASAFSFFHRFVYSS